MQQQVPVRVEQHRLCDDIIGRYPISINQNRLWVFYEREPESPLYNFPVGLRITGPLDPGILRKALDVIMMRHAVLRTTFAASDGIPAQVIAKNRAVQMTLVDIGGLAETQRETELIRLANEEIRRPFDVVSDTMLRALLLCVAKAEHVLVLNTNLIAVDVWSIGILLRELTDAYTAYSVGKMPALPELSTQYADFAKWQRQWLLGEVLESRLSFWKRQLAGVRNVHHLPADFPRPTSQTHRGAREAVILPERFAESLKLLSQRERVSLFMTLLAAFNGLLYHYSGHDDIVVGTCAANRNRLETERVIGLFSNDLILRTDLSGNPTFRELLGRVRLTALRAYAYQDLPIGILAEELQPGRDLSRNPLFQVMFILLNDPTENLQIPGLRLSRYKLHPGTAEFDLMVLIESGRGLEILLEYNTDLFKAATIRQILINYEMILQAMLRDPQARIKDIQISSLLNSPNPKLDCASAWPS